MKRGAPGRDEAASQLAVLRQLNQQAAAELLGWTSRGLRDSGAPRNDRTRSYDGKKLVKWALERERAKHRKTDTAGIEFELQQEKLRELRRRNETEEKRWYRKDEVDAYMQAVFKRMGEHARAIEVQHGSEVGAAYRVMIDEALAGSNDALGSTG